MNSAFDTGIAIEPVKPGVMRGRTVPEWANMVGPFGGITAATLVHAVESQPDCHGQPVALTVNFAAPIADGEFDIVLRAARTNRTNQHWIVELTQDGDTKTTATALFGLRRETWAAQEAVMPAVPAPEDVAVPGFPPQVRWTRNFEMLFVEGAVPQPDSGPDPSSATTLWMRNTPSRPLDFPALTAMCDLFYPRIYRRLGRAVPAGTISMNIYFHADHHQLDAVGDDFLLGTAHANRFSLGYFDQSAEIFGRDGTLLATSQQIVYFKG